jgi:hypothetical protein
VQFPTVDSTNMVDERTCEVGGTPAPLVRVAEVMVTDLRKVFDFHCGNLTRKTETVCVCVYVT